MKKNEKCEENFYENCLVMSKKKKIFFLKK